MNLKTLLHREISEGMSEEQMASAVGVSLGTITDILTGKNPTLLAIWDKFARYFRMDVDFLQTGQSTYRTSHSAAGRIRNIPLMSWHQMGELARRGDLPAPIHAEAMIEATDVSGSRTFALKVEDDSMEPLFRKGEMLFVNPDLEGKPGDYVVVTRRADDKAATLLRQVTAAGGQRLLHPFNWEYEDLPLAAADIVWGKVVRVRKNF